MAEIAKERGLQPHTVRSVLSKAGFEGGARAHADEGQGSSGDRLSGVCQADLKPTKSISAKRRCSINGCNNKREEGIAELIQIIWQIRIPAVAALPGARARAVRGQSWRKPQGAHGPGKTCRPTILQKRHDAFIRRALSLEPGRICMIMPYSQIAPAHPKPDARFAF